MYGYLTPDKPYLCFKDYALYRAFYCGTCKRLSKLYGQAPRLTTNYDITFLEVLVFSFENVTPDYDKKACVLNPFRKKPIVRACGLLDGIVAFNVLLAFHNLTDDVIDGEGLKKMLPRAFLRRAYRKAARTSPALDEIIRRRYGELRALETAQTPSFDRAADPFGQMMRDCLCALVSVPTEPLRDFGYHIGKFIYLLDALDDLTKDAKRRTYNPFLAMYPLEGTREAYLEAHGAEFRLAIETAINRCRNAYLNMHLTLGKDLLDNLILRGLSRKLELVWSGVPKAAKEKV